MSRDGPRCALGRTAEASFHPTHSTSFTLPRSVASAGARPAMTWRSVDVQEQRVRFVVAASRQEKTFRDLCQEFEVSRPTGYLWLQRYRGRVWQACRTQPATASEPSAQRGAVRAASGGVAATLSHWGARKLQILLAQAGVRLPVSTIHRILLRRGLVRAEDRHQAAVHASNGPRPTSCGKWISKAPRAGDGTRRWARCRCWTITAVI